MRHEPSQTFQIDEADRDLIACCKAAQKALRHEGRICGDADDLLFKVERQMPPPKYGLDLFWLRPGLSASDIREHMREMRAQRGGYNKGTYSSYKSLLPKRVEYEALRDAEFRRLGGNRLKRREAASRRRINELMAKICGTPAQTPLGLSFKCSVIPAWIEAGFDISEETQLIRSIIDDQNTLCRGWAPRSPTTSDQSLISLAVRSERQLKRNQATWNRLSVLQDKQTDFARSGQKVPQELARELQLANSRARYADRVSNKHLKALAEWPALDADGYFAKCAAYKAFCAFHVRSEAGSELYASLQRDFGRLEERRRQAMRGFKIPIDGANFTHSVAA